MSKIGVNKLHNIIIIAWKKKELPRSWSTAEIVPINIKKTDNKFCCDYRGKTVLKDIGEKLRMEVQNKFRSNIK